MSEPRLLTTLWAFTACYKASFIFYGEEKRKERTKEIMKDGTK
jgi:hypothetical protein